jgi:hypothetical protein
MQNACWYMGLLSGTQDPHEEPDPGAAGITDPALARWFTWGFRQGARDMIREFDR